MPFCVRSLFLLSLGTLDSGAYSEVVVRSSVIGEMPRALARGVVALARVALLSDLSFDYFSLHGCLFSRSRRVSGGRRA